MVEVISGAHHQRINPPKRYYLHLNYVVLEVLLINEQCFSHRCICKMP